MVKQEESNPDSNNVNENIIQTIEYILNKINELWEDIKKKITDNMESFYNFLRLFTAKHLFSMIMVGVCILLFLFINIPQNWHTNWHHLYYFGLVILMGLALFRYDMEDIVDKDIKTEDEEKGQYIEKKKEKNVLMKKKELLRKLLANPDYIKDIKEEDTDLFGEDGIDYNNLKSYANSNNETKRKQDEFNKLNEKLDEIKQSIGILTDGLKKNAHTLSDCDNVTGLIDGAISNVGIARISNETIKKTLEEQIKQLKVLKGKCKDSELNTDNGKKNYLEQVENFNTGIDTLLETKRKGMLENKNLFTTSIKEQLEKLKNDYKKKKESGDETELIKAQQRNIPKTLSQQFKAYFKYLSITSCAVFLLFLMFKIYQGSGSTVKYGIHMLVVLVFIGLLFFVTYSISSKRLILKPSWAKTSSSKEVGVKQKKVEKLKKIKIQKGKGLRFHVF